ncbi:helix-turn-helix domain-containing protein [Saccharothrix lopnurensis]|uniref:Helix-turn-helix domain-containing protein n=1 Tax=Saccharothrix lopnurensis TaxID=1670621 RepID=A0ABW1PG55_9PSEU
MHPPCRHLKWPGGCGHDATQGTRRDPTPLGIGRRARTIRRRRGLSLGVAAGLAGISAPYLSMPENGRRRFERRGLLEDIGVVLFDATVPTCPPGGRTDRSDNRAYRTGVDS